jgi:hypothetical protein
MYPAFQIKPGVLIPGFFVAGRAADRRPSYQIFGLKSPGTAISTVLPEGIIT